MTAYDYMALWLYRPNSSYGSNDECNEGRWHACDGGGHEEGNPAGKELWKALSGKPLTKPYRPNIFSVSQVLNGALHPATILKRKKNDYNNNFKKLIVKILRTTLLLMLVIKDLKILRKLITKNVFIF